MAVVSEKVGSRPGKELVSPIAMEGGYAAIRRVREARRKEVLQVPCFQAAPRCGVYIFISPTGASYRLLKRHHVCI